MAVLLRWISVQARWQESAKDTESHGKEFTCLTEQMLPWVCLLEAFPQELSSGTAWGAQSERASQVYWMCAECEKSLTNQRAESAGKKYKIWDRLVNTHSLKHKLCISECSHTWVCQNDTAKWTPLLWESEFLQILTQLETIAKVPFPAIILGSHWSHCFTRSVLSLQSCHAVEGKRTISLVHHGEE